MTDREIILEIQRLLSQDWSLDTLLYVAQLLEQHGYKPEGFGDGRPQ